jgi:DNA polymerase III sliding clamp (beta) subunit (PCNA family)
MQKQHINLLNSVIEKKNTIPILDSLFINNGILTATDLDIEVKIKTDLYKDIKSCVKFETIKQIFDAKKTGVKTNDIEIIVTTNDALIRKGTDKNNISKIADVYNVDDYPLMTTDNIINPKIKDKVVLVQGFDVNLKDLQKAMNKIYHAMSKEETRYYLAGINIKAVTGNKFIELVATDGTRMLLKQIETKEIITSDFSFILSRKTIDVLLDLDIDGFINIDVTGKYDLKNKPIEKDLYGIKYYYKNELVHTYERYDEFNVSDAFASSRCDNKLYDKYEYTLLKKWSESFYDNVKMSDIYFELTKVKFTINEIDITTKVIDGTYPDYNRVIPTKETFETLTIKNTRDFLSDLKGFLKLSGNRVTQAKFTIVNDVLTINEANTNRPVSTTYDNILFTSTDIIIGLNVKYVIEMLENIEMEDVSINFYDASTPIKIVNNNDIYVLMPVRV